MSTQQRTQHRAGARLVRRIAGVVAAAAVGLAVAPGVAAAKPVNPSDQQISQAEQQQTDAQAVVGQIAGELAAAQAGLDDARARSAIALDEAQGKQADYEAAQDTAAAATAEAQQADADLAEARTAIAGFARQSYMEGTTDAGLKALTTADGPAQMLERAALLDAAGSHRSDVVVATTEAQARATAAKAAADTALEQAADLKEQAEQALAAATALESAARQQAADVQARSAQAQQELQAAREQVLGLQGARKAAEDYDRAQQAAQAAARAAAEKAAAERASAPKAPTVSRVSSGTTASAGAGSGSKVETAISAARRYLGTIYSWGGGSLSGPSMGWGIDAGIVGFDCSGLTRYAYAQAGVSIPRNSSAQYRALPKVTRADLQRGDLVFWALDTNDPATIHHVAIYLGDGQILEAPESGRSIRVTSMRWGGYIGAVRPTA
ncbi:NlpC/P60 family protein [Modestobacter sp. NPDC049651]|uniref:C40 family peptidase n=1 Tax=unclassified Modestobacter TaxID=2643866 RepID=UPI0033FF747C